jgi:hypothetical protein
MLCPVHLHRGNSELDIYYILETKACYSVASAIFTQIYKEEVYEIL